MTVAEDLARLFHRTYERVAPQYGHGQGVGWARCADTYRQALVDTFADMELALRAGRCVVELHTGQKLILLLTGDANDADLASMQDQVQEWMPDNPVRVIAGVAQAVCVDADPDPTPTQEAP